MKDIFLVMNPGSHSGRSQKSFDQIIQLMSQSGADFDFRQTVSLEDARLLSRQASLDGYKIVVAVGGDGTINAVVNGLFTPDGHRFSDAKFGVIYTGTSPDFNRSYRIPLAIDQAVGSILKKNVREIQVGMITFGDSVSEEPPEVRYFVCCVNVGLGALLARKANGGIRRKLGDFCGTLLSLIGLLFHFKTFSVNSLENDSETTIDKVTNISIGITPYIASGIKVPVDFASRKKEFYKMTVRNLNLLRIAPLLKKVYIGKPFENKEYLFFESTPQIALFSSDSVEIEADGDPVGFLPCRISFATDNLQLVVPE